MSSSFKTFLKHAAKDFHNQSVNPPVVRASTIIFKSTKDIRKTQANAQKNPIGTKLSGKIQNITDFGLFVKVSEDLDGLVHMSDVDWRKSGSEAMPGLNSSLKPPTLSHIFFETKCGAK